MEATRMGYIGTTVRIHSFIPSKLKASFPRRAPTYTCALGHRIRNSFVYRRCFASIPHPELDTTRDHCRCIKALSIGGIDLKDTEHES